MLSKTAQFVEQGFMVIPKALTSDQLRTLNVAVDDWRCRKGSDSTQSLKSASVLLEQRDFDILPVNPLILAPICEIFGEALVLEEFTLFHLAPLTVCPSPPGWHRDFPLDPQLPLGASALSVIYYLTDVGLDDHCFSIMPGSHQDHSIKANDETAYDVHGRAGTAIVFHTACLHAGRRKKGAGERRTAHIYYGHAERSQCSAHSYLPRQLADSINSKLPSHFFRYCTK